MNYKLQQKSFTFERHSRILIVLYYSSPKCHWCSGLHPHPHLTPLRGTRGRLCQQTTLPQHECSGKNDLWLLSATYINSPHWMTLLSPWLQSLLGQYNSPETLTRQTTQILVLSTLDIMSVLLYVVLRIISCILRWILWCAAGRQRLCLWNISDDSPCRPPKPSTEGLQPQNGIE